MSVLPTDKNFPIGIPRAPSSMDELIRWAGDVVVAMEKIRDKNNDVNVYSPEYASAITYRPSVSNILELTTVHATGDCTITAKTGKIGTFFIIIHNDATSGKTITFGTGFVVTSTLVGTASKTAIVEFLSNGTSLYEVSRKTGL